MKTPIPIRIRSRRRGIALVLVVFVMALAAILGYAMLSASALQATAGGNAIAAATARAQAESGIHLAMYYLLNPNNVPGAPNPPPWNWSNVTFATTSPVATIPGSVTIQVGSPSNGCYPVIATGSSGSTIGGGAVTRTITAEICVGGSYEIQQGGAFNSPVILGAQTTITSASPSAPAVASSGSVTNNGQISGNIVAASVVENGVQTNGSVTITPSLPAPAPTSFADVNDYTQPYVYQGVTCYPTQITVATLNASPSSSPTTNPLGIYYVNGALTVSGTVSIVGTLIVEGTLTNSGKLTITPAVSTLSTNMPALVIKQKLTMSGPGRTLAATGVVYIGQQISGMTATSNITINGAMLISGGTPINGSLGTVSVTYNPAYTNIPGFVSSSADASQTTPWVKIISWSE